MPPQATSKPGLSKWIVQPIQTRIGALLVAALLGGLGGQAGNIVIRWGDVVQDPITAELDALIPRLEQLLSDPYARPDSFTRSDWEAQRDAMVGDITALRRDIGQFRERQERMENKIDKLILEWRSWVPPHVHGDPSSLNLGP